MRPNTRSKYPNFRPRFLARVRSLTGNKAAVGLGLLPLAETLGERGRAMSFQPQSGVRQTETRPAIIAIVTSELDQLEGRIQPSFRRYDQVLAREGIGSVRQIGLIL